MVEIENEDIEAIVMAMEIVYLRRMEARLHKFKEKIPLPGPGDPSAMSLYKLIYEDLNDIHELVTLRAKYVRRVHVDPEYKKGVELMWRKLQ
ncbi:MAG TPA: hypothetical protein PLM24_08100 [Methanothrix sp.]|nr:hypothetical protein [Methanothrix sp.]HPJ84832.1 hypothetical protein [Methanothrix sp.]HPR67078.1 hypothetical protein [Methanothrix sp.]